METVNHKSKSALLSSKNTNYQKQTAFFRIQLFNITWQNFSTFFWELVSTGQGFILTNTSKRFSFFFKFVFGWLWSCVPSQGHEGPVKVTKQPQDTIQEMEPHQALSDQAPFHLQGKHITDYLACVETPKSPSITVQWVLRESLKIHTRTIKQGQQQQYHKTISKYFFTFLCKCSALCRALQWNLFSGATWAPN